MRTRRERLQEATREEIKAVARKQMAERGAAALSLRAIAGEMGLTAPPSTVTLGAVTVSDHGANRRCLRRARGHPGGGARRAVSGGLRRAVRGDAVHLPGLGVGASADFTLVYGTPSQLTTPPRRSPRRPPGAAWPRC